MVRISDYFRRLMPRAGIARKITLLICLTAIFASSTIGFVTYWQFDSSLVRQQLAELDTLAKVKGDRFKSEVKELSADVLFLSRIAAMHEWTQGRSAGSASVNASQIEAKLRERLAATYLSLLNAKPQYFKIRLIGIANEGREIVRADCNEDGIHAIADEDLQSKLHEPFFRPAIDTPAGQVYLSPINLNREHGHVSLPYTPAMRAAVSIRSQNGVVLGFVIINRRMEPLFKSLNENLSPRQTLTVVDERGEYLVHPDPAKTFAFESGRSSRIQDDYPQLKNVLDRQSPDGVTILRTAAGNKSVLALHKIHFDPAHPDRFVAFVLSTDYDEVVADSVRTSERCLWAGAVVLALALLLSHQLSRSVTHPLRLIALAAEHFGTGETDIALPTHARDETGSVARALRQMFDQVQERTSRLESEIADRKRAELATLDRTARMQAILDGATDAIITISATGIVESFNRAAERMFRYRAEEVIGKNVRVLMPSPFQEEHDQYLRNYLETSIARIIGIGREVVGLRSDGTTFPMHLAVSEVKLGEQRFFTGIVRDISQLKQTIEQLTETHHALEERARDLEAARRMEVESRGNLEAAQQISLRAESNARDQSARTQAILDGATDAIITISSAGLIESFNGAAERMFGYAAAEVIGGNVKMLMPAPYRDEHDQYLSNYVKTGVSKIIGIGREVIGLRADGSTFPMDLAVSEVKLGDRRLFTGIVRDITELKRALQQLSEAHDELTRRAQKIERFNSHLSRSNEDLKQFAYVASHDLQEPLRKVTAFCQLLQNEYNDRLDDNAREYIRYAVDGSLRMKTLVTDLLAYSRVETQGKPLEPTDANEACRQAIENLSVAIEEAAATITADPLPTVVADPLQLVRLFQNLIANAIKYRSTRPPDIHISAEDARDEWLIRVHDNGIGIEPQYHERIFVIFQRLHARDEYSGTGIGLAVCKRMVERAGGKIWVESSGGTGSDFCFTASKPDHHFASLVEEKTNEERNRQPALSSSD